MFQEHFLWHSGDYVGINSSPWIQSTSSSFLSCLIGPLFLLEDNGFLWQGNWSRAPLCFLLYWSIPHSLIDSLTAAPIEPLGNQTGSLSDANMICLWEPTVILGIEEPSQHDKQGTLGMGCIPPKSGVTVSPGTGGSLHPGCCLLRSPKILCLCPPMRWAIAFCSSKWGKLFYFHCSEN